MSLNMVTQCNCPNNGTQLLWLINGASPSAAAEIIVLNNSISILTIRALPINGDSLIPYHIFIK